MPIMQFQPKGMPPVAASGAAAGCRCCYWPNAIWPVTCRTEACRETAGASAASPSPASERQLCCWHRNCCRHRYCCGLRDGETCGTRDGIPKPRLLAASSHHGDLRRSGVNHAPHVLWTACRRVSYYALCMVCHLSEERFQYDWFILARAGAGDDPQCDVFWPECCRTTRSAALTTAGCCGGWRARRAHKRRLPYLNLRWRSAQARATA